MIWKLLRKNISASHMAGYALAAFMGLAIIITALKFYGDVGRALLGGEKDKVNTNEYIVVSTPVSIFDTLGIGGASQGIASADISELAEQPWVEDYGAFTPAGFSVTGGVNLGGRGLYSYIFLESVPDRFIDRLPRDFKFDASDPFGQEVPVIVPREYLSLYNFGFAPARNLPQLSESLVTTLSADLYLNGNGHSDSFKGRIVGFSDRINTLAVPEEFMHWANKRYAPASAQQPSRIIIEVNNPGDPAIKKFLDRHGLVAAAEDLEQGKAAFLLRLVTGILVAIGAIICVLSLFILLLSINLLLQKNKEKNAMLLLLGYSPSQVSACYFKFVAIVNSLVLVVAIIAMLISSAIWQKVLAAIDIPSASPLLPILTGVAIMAIITAINFLSISRAVRQSF